MPRLSAASIDSTVRFGTLCHHRCISLRMVSVAIELASAPDAAPPTPSATMRMNGAVWTETVVGALIVAMSPVSRFAIIKES